MARNYRRFYAILKQHPRMDKEEMVLRFTDGRTVRLTEMSDAEYEEMVSTLSRDTTPSATQEKIDLRKARSSALLRLGRLGINTIDNWDGINAFVSSPRIAGKPFAHLDVFELESLSRKLEMILKKGGLKAINEEEEEPDSEPERIFNRPGVVVHIRPSKVTS